MDTMCFWGPLQREGGGGAVWTEEGSLYRVIKCSFSGFLLRGDFSLPPKTFAKVFAGLHVVESETGVTAHGACPSLPGRCLLSYPHSAPGTFLLLSLRALFKTLL